MQVDQDPDPVSLIEAPEAGISKASSGAAYLAERIPPLVIGYEQLAQVLYGGRRAARTIKEQRARGNRTVPPPSGRLDANGNGARRVYWFGADIAEWLEMWRHNGEPPTEEVFQNRQAALQSHSARQNSDKSRAVANADRRVDGYRSLDAVQVD